MKRSGLFGGIILDNQCTVHDRMELFSRALGRAVVGEPASSVSAKLRGLGNSHHRAVQEDRFVITADGKTMTDAQPVVGRFEGDLHDLPFLYPNDRRIIFPRALDQIDAHVRCAELLPDEKVLG